MTKTEKQACKILIKGLEDIRDRKCGAMFRVPEFAKQVLIDAQNALKNATAPLQGTISLETDSLSAAPEFNDAKRFLERFITDEKQVQLECLDNWTNTQWTQPDMALYELTVDSKYSTTEMLDWLADQKCGCFTTTREGGIVMYFEIKRSVGNEQAYLVKNANKTALTRVK